MTVFEFISAKLWFWLVLAIAWVAILAAGFFFCITRDLHGKVEMLVIKIPGTLCIMAWALFIFSVALRAWGV